MKNLLISIISFFSLTALAGPMFELENVSFLYSEYDIQVTYVAGADPNDGSAVNKYRDFGPLVGSSTINAGTQFDSSYLGYDFNSLGALWFDNNLNLYGLNFDGSSGGPVKLVDGSIIQNIGSNDFSSDINGIYSYGNYNGIQDPNTGTYDDLGSPDKNQFIPVESYVYDTTPSFSDYIIDCQTLQTCGNDIVGMQYFDSKDDGFLNGDLFYVSKDEFGNIKDSAIFAYNLGINEVSTAFTFEELGITDDIAPTRGFTFFNDSMLSLPGVEQPPVEVTEPGTIGLLTIGTVALAGAKKGVVKAICKKSGFCVLIDTVKKAIVGTAKAKK